jgi:hypothetical protein
MVMILVQCYTTPLCRNNQFDNPVYFFDNSTWDKTVEKKRATIEAAFVCRCYYAVLCTLQQHANKRYTHSQPANQNG